MLGKSRGKHHWSPVLPRQPEAPLHSRNRCYDLLFLDYGILWYNLPVSIAHYDLTVYLPETYDRMICVHQNKIREESMRESRPLLSSTDLEESHSNNLEVMPSIHREEINDDRTDFEIPTFRYVY